MAANRGLGQLVSVLKERKVSSDEKSYTRRLYADGNLLKNKLVEEAIELAEVRYRNRLTDICLLTEQRPTHRDTLLQRPQTSSTLLLLHVSSMTSALRMSRRFSTSVT